MFGKYRKPLLIAMVLAVPVLAGCNTSGGQGQDESKGTITIGIGPPFPTARVPAEIAKITLEEHGYDIEYVAGEVGFTFAGVASGDIDLYFDDWSPLQDPYLERYGDIEQLAVSYGNAKSGFWVPTYMEKFNTVEDLVGNEDVFDGTVYTPGEGYGTTISTKEYLDDHPELKLEGLPSSEAALMTTVSEKTRSKEPVVFTFYKPQTLYARYDYKLLEGSVDYFGVNTIWVIATPTFEDDFPEAHAAMSNWSFDINDIQRMMAEVDDGAAPDEVAQEWVDNHQDLVDSWWE